MNDIWRLDFHEDLHRIGAREGLKGRKLQKAMESYAWNITVLKVKEPSSALGTHAGVLRGSMLEHMQEKHPAVRISLTCPVCFTSGRIKEHHCSLNEDIHTGRADTVSSSPSLLCPVLSHCLCPLHPVPSGLFPERDEGEVDLWRGLGGFCGQADLLKHAKGEAVDTLRQIHCAAHSCGLAKNGASTSPASPLLPPHARPLHTIHETEPDNSTLH
ncbi:Inactive phospholipase C-like protein 1 [Labeo rohita]|uniref:Inactive phospholipase C-like protein 1 n=1 Tax=Labeo rohita TaxID=84645 RepID=A0ABQ8MU61_LABRO|nr:Inactive phospholipase C-like protein 1 [Labeo rohita]